MRLNILPAILFVGDEGAGLSSSFPLSIFGALCKFNKFGLCPDVFRLVFGVTKTPVLVFLFG